MTKRDIVRGQPLRIYDDLVLLLESTDGRHLSHAVNSLQFVLKIEVLDTP